MPEVLLYEPIWSLSAKEFVEKVEESDGPLTVRINSSGGSPEFGFGMLNKLSEYEDKVSVMVDGKAYSMAAFMLCFAGEASAAETSNFMLHRAGFPIWYEENYMTDGERKNVENINASLRKAMEATVNIERFEKLAGFTLDEMFDMADRKEAFFTAKQAKRIGLISKVVKLDPQRMTAMRDVSIAAQGEDTKWIDEVMAKIDPDKKKETKSKNIDSNKNTNMTLAELKEKHPDVYAEVISAGVDQEKNRVKAWLPWIDTDKDTVVKAIKEGSECTQAEISDFSQKMAAAGMKKAIESNNAPVIETDKPANESGEVTAEQEEINAFMTKVDPNWKPEPGASTVKVKKTEPVTPEAEKETETEEK